ncbi:MAG: hypothetical protein WBD47_13020, partial [Phormidesmis sp.]
MAASTASDISSPLSNGIPVEIPAEFDSIYRGVSEVFPHQAAAGDGNDNLLVRLHESKQPLRIKLGIDPTGSEIHLGHSTLVRKLRAFQDAGHTAVLL